MEGIILFIIGGAIVVGFVIVDVKREARKKTGTRRKDTSGDGIFYGSFGGDGGDFGGGDGGGGGGD